MWKHTLVVENQEKKEGRHKPNVLKDLLGISNTGFIILTIISTCWDVVDIDNSK